MFNSSRVELNTYCPENRDSNFSVRILTIMLTIFIMELPPLADYFSLKGSDGNVA